MVSEGRHPRVLGPVFLQLKLSMEPFWWERTPYLTSFWKLTLSQSSGANHKTSATLRGTLSEGLLVLEGWREPAVSLVFLRLSPDISPSPRLGGRHSSSAAAEESALCRESGNQGRTAKPTARCDFELRLLCLHHLLDPTLCFTAEHEAAKDNASSQLPSFCLISIRRCFTFF